MTEEIYKEATSLKWQIQKNESAIKMLKECERCVFFTADDEDVEFVYKDILEPLRILAVQELRARINILQAQFDAL